MISDSIPNASLSAVSNSKDFAKKKRANRSAKLKQCKLDARREQWLSQVKINSVEDSDGGRENRAHAYNEFRRSIIKDLQINPIGDDHDESMRQYSDSESALNSPISRNSYMLSSNDSGTNFTGSGSSRSSNGWCCSGSIGSITEDDEGDDGCFDDWEAIADALAEQDNHNSIPESQSLLDQKDAVQQDSINEIKDGSGSGIDNLKPMSDHVQLVRRAPVNCCAWTPGDAFRPQSLPILSKQNSFPVNAEWHQGGGGNVWTRKNVMLATTSCPICCEDLDFTDSSFLPCLCGFRLCLFCHKRILEEDGRCPGCRKQYDYVTVGGEETLNGDGLTFQLARSCSMISRS